MGFKKILSVLAFVACFFCHNVESNRAHAEDAYNFYFQKAPGPVTVNQGAAPSIAPKSEITAVEEKNGATAQEKNAARIATMEARVEDKEVRLTSWPKWKFSLGLLKGADISPGGWGSNFGKSVAQLALGLQYNPFEILGFEGQAFSVQDPKIPEWMTSLRIGGSPYDGSLGLVLTPLRSKYLDSPLRLAFSATGGATTVPRLSHAPGTPFHYVYSHERAAYFGARIELEAFRSFSLQVSARRINRFNSSIGGVSLAYMF